MEATVGFRAVFIIFSPASGRTNKHSIAKGLFDHLFGDAGTSTSPQHKIGHPDQISSVLRLIDLADRAGLFVPKATKGEMPHI
jgi:hypothetical protein